MDIRLMQITDYNSVYALWNRVQGLGLRSIDDSELGIKKFLMRNPKTNFVAVEDGRIVGVIMSGHDGRRGYIYHACVDTPYRNAGLGQQLVERALNALKDEGINKAALVVFAKNDTGNGFWRSSGWEMRGDLHYYNINLNMENH